MPSSILFSRQLVFLAVLTLIIVGLYEVLPDKKWNGIPHENITAHIYADSMHGGDSTSTWLDEGSLHFHCELVESPKLNAPPFCGFHLHIDTEDQKYIDLSRFTRVVFNVDYSGGNEKLRFYLTDFVPGFSNPVDTVRSGTGKYLSAYVAVNETERDFVVQMDEYLVADWWVNDNNVPRKYSRASREHIMILGVDIAYPSALGQHEFKLNKVEFYGPWISAEHWYLSIVLIWVGIILSGSFLRIYYLRRHTSKLQKEKNKYQQLSTVDPLTGLLNRNGISAFFNKDIAKGTNEWPVSMVLIDIDHFKLINDKYGHDTGDVILCRIANALTEQTRHKDKVSRWGGEEFLIILPQTALSDAYDLADKLRTKVLELSHSEISYQSTSISIGISEMMPSKDFKTAFGQADSALYRAKNKGRNCIVIEADKKLSD